MSQPATSQPTTSQPSDSIRIYNTLTRAKEPFRTVTPGKVGIYLCGPTVYKRAHMGHMVGPVVFDAVKRYLQYCGYDVTWVVNITDVDDKLIAQAEKTGQTMKQVADEMTADYLENLRAVGVDQIDQMPKATDHIGEIVEFISDLIQKGFAYDSEGDVFFDVGADAEYGKLSNRSRESLQGEGGGAAGKKRAPADFALWKSAKPGEPSWDSPWGKGRPGWHIECSAMSRRILGKTFDIHAGGLDLIFPHHENEVAQSECCHGQPMSTYWMHNGLMRAGEAGKIGGRADREQPPAEENVDAAVKQKLSGSKGDGGLADLIARFGGQTIRFFLLRTHYRSTIVFNEEGLTEAATSLEGFTRFIERFERVAGQSFFDLPVVDRHDQGEVAESTGLLGEVADHRRKFLTRMDDDFNTGAAISDLFELLRTLNKYVDQQQLEDVAQRTDEKLQPLLTGTRTLRELTSLLGIFEKAEEADSDQDQGLVDALMQLLIELRATARGNKDFAMADTIRNRLGEIGVTLEDRKDGTLWRAG